MTTGRARLSGPTPVDVAGSDERRRAGQGGVLGPAFDLERTRHRRLARAADLWSSADRERFNLTFAGLRDGTVIGDVHAWNMAEQFQPASPDPAEGWIGYAFSPRNHGHGYATEAMKFLFDWLFARGTERVFANTYTDNTRSVALLRRLGFEEHRP